MADIFRTDKPLAVSPIKTGMPVRLWNFCTTDDPNQQIRGSANAPRPNDGVNHNAPPPGADPNAVTAPLPGGF